MTPSDRIMSNIRDEVRGIVADAQITATKTAQKYEIEFLRSLTEKIYHGYDHTMLFDMVEERIEAMEKQL